MANQQFYTKGKYLKNNPSLHSEDVLFKFGKIKPFLDVFAKEIRKKKVKIMDVGGGSGLIIKEVQKYLKKRHGIKVEKVLLELSPEILAIQKKKNKDAKAIHGSVTKIPLKSKVDLTLMIDVLEHVPNPNKALKELRRVSKFVLFKVPLEDCLAFNTVNWFTRGRFRQRLIKILGHINVYSKKSLEQDLKKYCGEVWDEGLVNAYKYSFLKERRLDLKIFYLDAWVVSWFSESLAQKIYGDFLMVLVKTK
tara:strand:+ start:1535 stop:2284 length:750 start_codon:yes stop_codon:yes gene_type:complete